MKPPLVAPRNLSITLTADELALIAEAVAAVVGPMIDRVLAERAAVGPATDGLFVTEQDLERRLGLKPRSLQNRRLMRHDVPPYEDR